MRDPNLKLELTLEPGTVFLGNGGVEKWVSLVGGHCLTQDTVGSKPKLLHDGLYFDGGDTLGGTVPTMNTRTAWTIEWWQCELSQSGFQTPFYLYSPATLYVSFNASTVYLSDGVTNTISGAAITRTLNAWIHTAVSFDGTTYRFYRDGVQVASATTLLASGNVSSLSLQSFNNGASNWINGWLNDFRIYHTCLYPGGVTFTPPPRSQLAMPAPSLPPLAAISAAVSSNQFQFGG